MPAQFPRSLAAGGSTGGRPATGCTPAEQVKAQPVHPRPEAPPNPSLNQNTDPFKFIIYSGKIGEQTPQINAEQAK